MPTLTNWYINMMTDKEGNECCIAHGVVTGHKRLKDNNYSHTSKITEMKYDGDVELRFNTKSGSEYVVNLRDMNMRYLNDLDIVCDRFNMPSEVVDKCLCIMRNVDEEYRKLSDELLGLQELYINLHKEKVIYKDINGRLYNIDIKYHSGMFQDSILFVGGESCEVDFRYFPSSFCANYIQPYSWSKNIKSIFIDNKGSQDAVYIDLTEHQLKCEPDSSLKVVRPSYWEKTMSLYL